MRQITRVARLAISIEVRFTRFGVSGDNVQALVESAIGHQFYLQVQELCNIVELFFREVGERGHAVLDNAFGEQRSDQLALLVMQHDRGPH